MSIGLLVFGTLVLVLVVLLLTSLRSLDQHERGVMFTLGRFSGVNGTGRVFVMPFVQTLQRVDLRPTTLPATVPDARTSDGVAVQIEATLHYCIDDPQAAILQVADIRAALAKLAQSEARAVVRDHDTNDVLSARQSVIQDLTMRMQARAAEWGVHLTDIELTARHGS